MARLSAKKFKGIGLGAGKECGLELFGAKGSLGEAKLFADTFKRVGKGAGKECAKAIFLLRHIC